MNRFWRRVVNGLKLVVPFFIFVVTIGPEWPAFQDERYKLEQILGQRYFDFVVWETRALAAKAEAALTSGQEYLDAEVRKELVLEYLTLIGEIRGLESEVNAIFADPQESDPAVAAHNLQRQIDEKRAEARRLQPVAEQILQGQVAAVLIDEGFDIFGTVLPPVSAQLTPLPYILIVSPRDEIRQIHNVPLQHGLTVPAQEEIESAVLAEVDRSALIVPIGGLGIWPAMIRESANINYLANTFAHEWGHHWLTFHPLGISYAASPELRTINETVASIFGDEIGAKVIERFYPEFVPPPADKQAAERTENEADSAPPFEFNQEMAETRIHVDELLTEGKVEEAEAYMEERRQFFWDNGYRIRKLNQAYFAFYGAYADAPGEQGADPIGPALLAIREDSDTLAEFMDRVASISSFEGFQAEAAGLGYLN
ncbi:MAG: hypothetical protein JSW55_10305 [Chloroflexota bacterium]|nr:MAG: hypothetical protein JSW55_10305 [Chloroflexota bacterium]